MTMTKQRRALLTLLAGCPTGATEATLLLHGHAMADALALCDADCVRAECQRHSNPRGLEVVRFWITARGREACR
jgi:hypothetical protein